MHTVQRCRPQTALFGCQWIIEADRMDSKSRLGSIGGVTKYVPLNLACLPRLFGFSAFIFVDFIARVPNARSCMILACLNAYDRKCINAVKFYRILRSLNLKFSPQNLIAPKFWCGSRLRFCAVYCCGR